MKKNTKSSYHTNKKMNDEVYKLRRQVIELIYEAKQVVELPRIEIRITDADRREVLGTARMNDCVVWITERAISDKSIDLRTVVYHEICHAVFGTEHDDKCPLMKPFHSKLTKKQCQTLIKKHAKNN